MQLSESFSFTRILILSKCIRCYPIGTCAEPGNVFKFVLFFVLPSSLFWQERQVKKMKKDSKEFHINEILNFSNSLHHLPSPPHTPTPIPHH